MLLLAGTSLRTHEQDFLEAAAQLVDDLAHVRHQDEDAQRTHTAQDEQHLRARARRHLGRHPAQEDQADLYEYTGTII